MFFISKNKMMRVLLQLMNTANNDRKAVEENHSATEQDKRDAFMFASGCLYCAYHALKMLRGEPDGEIATREHIRYTDEPR